MVMFLVLAISSPKTAIAQQGAKSEQEREAEIQKAIDQQKKAFVDQQKVMEAQKKVLDEKVKQGVITESDALKELESNQLQLDKLMKDVEVSVDNAGRNVRVYTPRTGARTFSYGGDPFIMSSEGVYFNGRQFGGDVERTTWDFTKSVKESTFSSSYLFDVEKTAKNVVMSVNGDCKAGSISIKILMPNGKIYSDYVIDEFGNLNFRKSFNISETENQDKTGTWKFQISSTKATGFFRISIQTN